MNENKNWLASRLWQVLRRVLPRPLETIGIVVCAVFTVAVLVNALFMQTGPHPAPIFAHKSPPVMAPHTGAVAMLMPQPRPRDIKVEPTVRSRSDVVAEIQRELIKRGFYEGAADGYYGPKTDSAIRDFEQAAGLRPSTEPNDVLLAAIVRSTARAPSKPVVGASAGRVDPIAALLGPSARVIAVQRALADFGYGPLKPTGVHDADTRAAIERFERARRRPATGQINELLLRDLSVLTGRPLE